MYDALRAVYQLRCPNRPDEAGGARTSSVPLSGFRCVTRLVGPAHPAVYQVEFACRVCEDAHVALVAQDELDWQPIGAASVAFWDPLTGRVAGDLAEELAQTAADRLQRGVWPWSFWCSNEARLVPGYPSALRYVLGRERRVGVAVTCSACGETSLNVVSTRHLDEPYFHDPVVHALERPTGELDEIERFRRALWSPSFDAHRTDLAA